MKIDPNFWEGPLVFAALAFLASIPFWFYS